MKSWRNIRELKSIRDDIAALGILGSRPITLGGTGKYFKYIGYSWHLMFKEKELFVFTLLQWSSVALGYYLFVMMLYWIPEEVWRSTENSDDGSIADLVLFLWMIACIGVAAMPLGIFSSCIAAVHMLHISGEKSTVARCLQIVLPRVWTLWLFHWFDGCLTVNRIIERLPKKNDRISFSEKALNEGSYYTWKVATMAILPNLIIGKGIKDTAKISVDLVKNNVGEMVMVRVGYSLCCWIIGISTYVIGFIHFGWIKKTFLPGDINSNIAEFYFLAGVPMLLSVGVIQLFLRPPYLLAISDIFARHMVENNLVLLDSRTPKPATSAFVAFGVLCLVLFVVYLYRYQLGIMDMLATPYGM